MQAMEISPLQNVGDCDSESIPPAAEIETGKRLGRNGKGADCLDYFAERKFCAKKEKMGIDICIGYRYNHIVERYIGHLIYHIVDIKEERNMPSPALTEGVYYILLSLLKPMHGYGIMLNTEILSKGRVKLAAGTLYGALTNLQDKGWIEALPGELDNRNKKEYVITKIGRTVLEEEVRRLEELVTNGREALGKKEEEQ
jgi:DNA-binding PadR family transcriptional regulator